MAHTWVNGEVITAEKLNDKDYKVVRSTEEWVYENTIQAKSVFDEIEIPNTYIGPVNLEDIWASASNYALKIVWDGVEYTSDEGQYDGSGNARKYYYWNFYVDDDVIKFKIGKIVSDGTYYFAVSDIGDTNSHTISVTNSKKEITVSDDFLDAVKYAVER